jgi:ABC-type transport system substrate-binding protein
MNGDGRRIGGIDATDAHDELGVAHDGPSRRRWLQSALGCSVGALLPMQALRAAQERDDGGKKVLRLLFESAETSLDPARISDYYSRTITSHLFEAMYVYDHLARPAKVVPCTAEGMPEVADNYRSWTIRIKRGIHYPDDPAFKGIKRELLARDYAYALMRVADPANISPIEATIADLGIVGLSERRRQAIESKTTFDYDTPIEGLQLPDSHTLRIRLKEPRPRFVADLALPDLLGGVAREVVEHYGDAIGEHPVGTGPFRVKSWRRSSRIVLERNPAYREVLYDAQPAAADAEGQAILARFKGRKLPMVSRNGCRSSTARSTAWPAPPASSRASSRPSRSRATSLHPTSPKPACRCTATSRPT